MGRTIWAARRQHPAAIRGREDRQAAFEAVATSRWPNGEHGVAHGQVDFQACSFIRLRSPREFTASDGEMSRRSGSAAEADNHSDISPFDSLRSLTAGRCRLNELRMIEKSLSQIR